MFKMNIWRWKGTITIFIQKNRKAISYVPLKRTKRMNSRKSAIYQNPLLDMSLKNKLGPSPTLNNKERVYDLKLYLLEYNLNHDNNYG